MAGYLRAVGGSVLPFGVRGDDDEGVEVVVFVGKDECSVGEGDVDVVLERGHDGGVKELEDELLAVFFLDVVVGRDAGVDTEERAVHGIDGFKEEGVGLGHVIEFGVGGDVVEGADVFLEEFGGECDFGPGKVDHVHVGEGYILVDECVEVCTLVDFHDGFVGLDFDLVGVVEGAEEFVEHLEVDAKMEVDFAAVGGG